MLGPYATAIVVANLQSGVLTTLGAGGGSVAAIKMQNIANSVLYA